MVSEPQRHDPAARDLDTVRLVTSTAGVAAVAGAGAVVALAAYPVVPGRTVLPSVGVGLSGGCYLQWRNSTSADPSRAGETSRAAETNKARTWLQRAIRGVELELVREPPRRLAAVHRALATTRGDAVDHGILLV